MRGFDEVKAIRFFRLYVALPHAAIRTSAREG